VWGAEQRPIAPCQQKESRPNQHRRGFRPRFAARGPPRHESPRGVTPKEGLSRGKKKVRFQIKGGRTVSSHANSQSTPRGKKNGVWHGHPHRCRTARRQRRLYTKSSETNKTWRGPQTFFRFRKFSKAWSEGPKKSPKEATRLQSISSGRPSNGFFPHVQKVNQRRTSCYPQRRSTNP